MPSRAHERSHVRFLKADVIVQPAAWAPLTAFAAALLTVWWLARGRLSGLILDHPNPRSLHDKPVPRTGGLGLHAGLLVAVMIIAPRLPAALWAAYAALLVVSLLDDARGIPPAWRLASHLAVSALFAAAVLLPAHGLPELALATVAIAWMANLYNFMDGSDGLAGGMAAIGFSCYAAAAALAGAADLALVSLSVAAAAAAFLLFNLHPARIFLGDAGSVPLGFLAAALGLIGWLQGDWPGWFPPLVFSAFIVDATVTLARRCLKREKIWQAHRDHYYQRLVRMGWGHRRTALAGYALMIASGGAALAALGAGHGAQAAVLAAAGLCYLALLALAERGWRRFEAGARP
jgi:UDP-N-acetylmuramyl pentapeptide phosphotransferase/UDP-N-acetylglucosamine-1-phosphate transferase